MIVIVFEETYDAFGPFKSAKAAGTHLEENGFMALSSKYWVNGDAHARIKTLRKPQK